MKKILFGVILGLGLFGASSCSKNDISTPCPTNPYNGQSLCGSWKDLTTSNDSVNEIWTLSRTNNTNTVSMNISKYGVNQYNYTFPFSIGPDTTFIRYDSLVIPGSGNSIWKISNSNDTLILTMPGDIQKFKQL